MKVGSPVRRTLTDLRLIVSRGGKPFFSESSLNHGIDLKLMPNSTLAHHPSYAADSALGFYNRASESEKKIIGDIIKIADEKGYDLFLERRKNDVRFKVSLNASGRHDVEFLFAGIKSFNDMIKRGLTPEFIGEMLPKILTRHMEKIKKPHGWWNRATSNESLVSIALRTSDDSIPLLHSIMVPLSKDGVNPTLTRITGRHLLRVNVL